VEFLTWRCPTLQLGPVVLEKYVAQNLLNIQHLRPVGVFCIAIEPCNAWCLV
jgi:hypothetical protein